MFDKFHILILLWFKTIKFETSYNMDLYLFNTLLNTFWYTFSVMFVLYRFTSFFTYAYNFVVFCGKLLKGLKHVYDEAVIYIRRKQGYSRISSDNGSELLLTNPKPKSVYQTVKEYFYQGYCKFYSYVWGEPHPNLRNSALIPLHTSVMSTTDESVIDKQIEQLCAENSFNNFNKRSSPRQHNNPEPSKQLFNDQFESVALHVPVGSCGTPPIEHFKTYFPNPVETDHILNSSVFDKAHGTKSKYESPYGMLESNALFDSKFIQKTLSSDQPLPFAVKPHDQKQSESPTTSKKNRFALSDSILFENKLRNNPYI